MHFFFLKKVKKVNFSIFSTSAPSQRLKTSPDPPFLGSGIPNISFIALQVVFEGLRTILGVSEGLF